MNSSGILRFCFNQARRNNTANWADIKEALWVTEQKMGKNQG